MSPAPRPWEAARDRDRTEGKADHPPAGPRLPEVQRRLRPGREDARPSPPPVAVVAVATTGTMTAGAMTLDHLNT